MRYVSFAQEFEDIILYSALGKHVKRGIYVDVGANDPCIISVTKFFYDRGWRGMNIEPLDDMYQLLCLERPEDENINAGVSDENGEMELGIMGTGSTFNETDASVRKCRKPVRKLAALWEQSRFCGKDVHFCKIDVEGFEKQVLKGIDFSKFRPWIFVIESTVPGTDIPCYAEWEDILTDNGYLCALRHGANSYYIAKDKEFLAEGLVCFGDMFIGNDILKVGYGTGYRNVINRLNEAARIALFGAGSYMNNFFRVFGKRYKPSIIVDNSVEKQGEEIFGIKIQSPEILRNYAGDKMTVLICCERTEEIKKQLDEMDITDYIEYQYI